MNWTGVISPVLALAAVTACQRIPVYSEPITGVLNLEPGTSLATAKRRVETEVCPYANVEILSGPEPSLDPEKSQVEFRCNPL